ncbi:13000_t:CDS:2 [Funneliformis geosporum]|uniref:16413_t:CDS:1 n=1 Tax=Funneliformis geosporum TaxID=1117311 RepID=A0A9W4SAS0_9GLOM|nr:16413_t:CDS:2 [Funneliformis geosporum]CAI2182158.1 13000_t:CDS:2 [Funneliformis geosporum]
MVFQKRKSSLLPTYNNNSTTSKFSLNFFNNKFLIKKSLLFGLIIFGSVTINLYYFTSYYLKDTTSEHSDRGENSLKQIFLPDASHPELKDLIIVAGHAIYLGNNQGGDEKEDENWILEEFQKGGQVKTFINHIKKGVELVKENEEALLIFSGGQTRPSAGPRSEAQSYYALAQSLNLLSNTNFTSTTNTSTNNYPLITRIITEEYARDSYENLLFSICRFNEYTNNYPRYITVIGFQFKNKRFVELHRFALKFPLNRFKYIGIDPDNTSPLGRFVGENVNSMGPFQRDLYGCHGKLLEKKLNRNPYRRSHPYQISCPELSSLFNYCPENQNQLFPDKLPWEILIN